MAGKDPTTMELFCYPEFSMSRNQLELHTLDYSHILTNICTYICNKGYEFCPNEHYVQLCENEPQILSKAAVMDHIDAQNVFTAIQFFGTPVEEYMLSCGYDSTAAFIKLVRNWFRACDERGMKADKRVEHLFYMHEFLTRNIDFSSFPSKVDGRYV